MQKKLLITGASGFLGYHLLREAAKNWEVYGLVNAGSINFANAVSVQCDISDYIALGNIFDDIEPDAVIHAGALADANYCETNRELSYNINVEASKNLAGICCDYQIPFAFTSTDLVFDGKKGMYKEDDEKNPISIYGQHKAIAEDEILKIYPESLVLRLSLIFGYAEASGNNFMQKMVGQLKAGQTVNLFYDEFRSVCGASSISKGILQLLSSQTGIIHLGGKERLSRYDFGLRIVRAFELPGQLIKSCSQRDVVMKAARPQDVSLDISKAQSLGFAPLLAQEELGMIAVHDNLVKANHD